MRSHDALACVCCCCGANVIFATAQVLQQYLLALSGLGGCAHRHPGSDWTVGVRCAAVAAGGGCLYVPTALAVTAALAATAALAGIAALAVHATLGALATAVLLLLLLLLLLCQGNISPLPLLLLPVLPTRAFAV